MRDEVVMHPGSGFGRAAIGTAGFISADEFATIRAKDGFQYSTGHWMFFHFMDSKVQSKIRAEGNNSALICQSNCYREKGFQDSRIPGSG